MENGITNDAQGLAYLPVRKVSFIEDYVRFVYIIKELFIYDQFSAMMSAIIQPPLTL